MAEAFVGQTAGGTPTQTADALLDAVASLGGGLKVEVVRVVEGGFMVPEAVADEAALPRYPQADCPEV